MNSPTQIPGRRRGATLVELVATISITGLIAVGIQSCIFVSLKGLPNSQGSAQAGIQASKIADMLSTELESAIYITEHTATTLGFTLADRNGDGIPERVRYSWSGVAGAPLTRQYNGGTVVSLASRVNLFTLTPTYTSVAETYSGLLAEDAVESLLIDNGAGPGANDTGATALNSLGQYFTYTLPANAYAWCPTRVQFKAKKVSSSATTLVQMRPAGLLLTPAGGAWEQYTFDDTSLTNGYTWKSINFSQVPPISSGGVCLTLARQSGATSVGVQDRNGTGELSGTLLDIWTYNGAKTLTCQLFGKLTRAGSLQSFNSNYLTTMGIALQTSTTAPVLQTTAAALNHPELLGGKWELKFDQNPTIVDINGDGTSDWVVHDGTAFNATTVSGGIWTTSGIGLDTAPGSDFAKTTVVDLRLQNTTVGGNGATFSLNALRSGSTCAPIQVNLMLQADGTQTLVVNGKTTDTSPKSLLTLAGLPGRSVDLHLIIDPVASAICIKANGVQRGTFPLPRFASSDSTRSASLGASGSTAQFSYACIRVLEQ